VVGERQKSPLQKALLDSECRRGVSGFVFMVVEEIESVGSAVVRAVQCP
jgi:hypothetical protein